MKDKWMRNKRQAHRAKSGQALVEFAVTLPLLAILLFGIIQYGFIFGAYMTLRHGVHQAARTLSLPNADMTSANALAVASAAITPMLDPANLGTPVVNTNVTVSATGDAVSVQLSYGLPLIIKYVVVGKTGNTLTLTAQATYRKESR